MKKTQFIFIIVFAIAVLVISPFIGSIKIPFSVLADFDNTSIASRIFYNIRLPRVLTAFIAGAALACCGVALQAMFRNPLATPFTLGISGGAAFGAAVYVLVAAVVPICLGSVNLLLYVRLAKALPIGIGPVSFSFLGSLAAALFIYGLTRLKKGFSVGTMLLAGVVVNFFFSSLILLLQYVSDFTQTFQIVRWLMGSVEVAGYSKPIMMFVFTAAGVAIIAACGAKLNLMSIGDEIAIARGVNVRGTRKVVFFATSIMVAGVVAFCGPIGFVGLMAPHICRLLIGCDHKILTPASVLFGGGFLVLCDTIARTVISPAEIPVGVITALLGGPFFVWLLIKDDSTGNAG